MATTAYPSPIMRRRGRQLLGASSYLCLALLLGEPSVAWAADLPTPPAMYTKAPAPAYLDHWFFSLEGGYMFRNGGNNVTFDPADSLAGGGPPGLGILPPIGPGHAGGTFALWAGRTFGPQWDWAVGYRDTLLGTSHATVATTLPLNLLGTFNNLSDTASSSLRFQTFDAEVGYRVPQWSWANVRVFAGPRVLNAHQEITYSYLNASDAVGGTFTKLGNFDHDISLWGVGPRVGLDASVPLFQGVPVTLDLSGSGSAIFSRTTHDFNFAFNNQTFPAPITGSGASHITSSHTVYDLEASAGLSYHVGHGATVEAGYQVQQWYRLATSVNSASSAGDFVEGRTNVLVHGPFAKITVELP
jgi:hypothetical protein